MQTAEAIIYVAGNPRLYPLEYYDVGSGTYEGAIPDFLGRFAAEYGYDLRYFEPQEADSRRDLAANLQVDLISGVQSGESYPNTAGEPLLLFEAGAGGAETAYQLLFTGAAPESFRAQLREFAARTSQAEWTGELLESAAEPRQGGSAPVWPFWAACLAAAVLAAALFTALWRLRRERNLTVRLRSTDPETGLGTEDALERAFSHLQRDQSRRYYYLLYFCLGLDRVGYMWGQEQAGALLQHAAQTLKGASAAGDVLARSGCGDLLVLRRFLDSAEAESWARAALEDIRAFPSAGERLGDGDISVGVCPLSAEYLDFSQAMFHAHQCALAALRLKAPCRTCCTEQCRLCQERWLLLSDFDRAMERGEFQLYLQFFVNAYNFRVVGGEALSRWKHPQLGVLSPGPLYPAAGGGRPHRRARFARHGVGLRLSAGAGPPGGGRLLHLLQFCPLHLLRPGFRGPLRGDNRPLLLHPQAADSGDNREPADLRRRDRADAQEHRGPPRPRPARDI